MNSPRILAASAALALPVLGAGTAHAEPVVKGDVKQATTGQVSGAGTTFSASQSFGADDSGDATACGGAKAGVEGTDANEKECVSTP
ncbi:hypothetical protein ACLGIH_00130 [Streptomyces sp. HMX87]|uniref:hypothetical protein n=1 Tax=Streptomyces sp. HMX87 TaxID=3390849 RepID=UPI003A8BE16B